MKKVPRVGVEPTRTRVLQLLRLSRLPVSPSRLFFDNIVYLVFRYQFFTSVNRCEGSAILVGGELIVILEER